jgi:glucose/arabinose dehydrogenase
MTFLLPILLYAASLPAAADYRLETVATGFDYPWCVAFLPDRTMLVTELGGRLLRVTPEGGRTPVEGVPPVYRASQGGLFDVLPDRGFATNGIVFLSYAEGTPDANRTAVARARLDGDALRDLEVIFRVTPDKDTPVHYGGRLIQLPDDSLLLTTGDGFDYREAAQDLGSQLGKTVRFNADGTPAAGNPFADAPYVWTYGHRNPQGLVRAADGTVYLHEHGPRGGDEVNRLEGGGNYGWPAVTFGLDYNGAFVSPFTEWPGMVQPIYQWTPSIAPSGAAIYAGSAFPPWRGDLFVGALVNRDIRRLDIEDGRIVGEEIIASELDARIRDVRTGPDGELYFLTDGEDGRLMRIVPAAAAP